MTIAGLMRAIWLTGGLALVLAPLRDFALRETVVKLAPAAEWCRGGFQPDGVYPATNPDVRMRGVRHVGSWLQADDWQGETETAWMPVSADAVRVWVAGYPQHAGCELRAEFRRIDGSIVPLDCAIPDPHETWVPWDIRPPVAASAMRLVARDHATGGGGWFGFAEPINPSPPAGGTAYMALQVFTTLALTLTLVWGPGLLWCPRDSAPEIRAAFMLGAGPLGLATLGGVIWLLGGALRPSVVASILVGASWVTIGLRLWRTTPALTGASARILAVATLVVVATVAKATFSGGPDGELYAGTISRTLAVGDRSDARISFHVVQAAAQHFAPASPQAERYFSPWTFFSRGPLAGLAAIPISLAAAGPPPPGMPEQGWQPFDSTGFAAYRIVLMTLASTVFFALFMVLVALIGETWALVGSGLLALCPFGVHDVMFTWPKWEATAWLLVGFLFAHQRRPFGAGLSLAVGFLFHPLAALWAPWLALWAGGRAAGGTKSFLLHGARFAGGVALLVVPWLALGRFTPHLETSVHAGQGGFIEYFRLAEYTPATWATWWRSRWMNFANTFLPFWLHFFHEGHPAIGSVYGPSGRLVKFAFSWWNTLPLGLGLALWASSLGAIVAAFRRFPAAVGLLLAGPALLLTAYWGASATGLMRESGHPLLVAVIGMTCLWFAQHPGRLGRWLAHPVFPWLQLPETLAMLWLTTWVNRRPAGLDSGLLNACCLLISVAALTSAAWILARARGALAAPGWSNVPATQAPLRGVALPGNQRACVPVQPLGFFSVSAIRCPAQFNGARPTASTLPGTL